MINNLAIVSRNKPKVVIENTGKRFSQSGDKFEGKFFNRIQCIRLFSIIYLKIRQRLPNLVYLSEKLYKKFSKNNFKKNKAIQEQWQQPSNDTPAVLQY